MFGRKKKNRKKILLIYLLIAVTGYGLGSYIKYTNNPSTCNNCHAMQPQVETWRLTAHGRLNCSACHGSAPITTYAFRTLTNRNSTPVSANVFIEDEKCLTCHKEDRNVTPPGDLIMPHRLHMEIGVNCIDCHSNVAHAQAPSRLVQGQLTASEFGFQDAAKLTKYGNRVPMSRCLECHNGRMAKNGCSACHERKDVPADHTEQNWDTGHGSSAFENLARCVDCHEYDPAEKDQYALDADLLTAVRIAARANDFCANCHQKRPATHGKFYLVRHTKPAQGFSQGCLACHNKSAEESTTVAPPTDVNCQSCHRNLHPQGWTQNHKNTIAAGDTTSCYSCHTASSCAGCHDKRNLTSSW